MIRNAKILALALLGAGCGQPAEQPLAYQTAPVVERDIIVAVEAAGIIEPSRTVEVKSKASGEILSITGETGDFVEENSLLVKIDKRSPLNNLSQAEAELEAAIARQSIAKSQRDRAKTLFESGTFNEVDYEQTILESANAKAEVARSRVAVENARIALEDTDVRAPISGTIIERLVERGQVISSPTMDVGGGTLLLKMADLSSVQVKALVDETDIGKISPGLPATVQVTAYPNQPFAGEVRKVEPQALAEQTVTTFSVLIVLDNEEGLLKPGMNADVEIRVAEALDALAVPTIALKTSRDITIASQLVGLTPDEVREQLAASGGKRPQGAATTNGAGARPPAAARPASGTAGYRFGSRYWVFVDRGTGVEAVNVQTGITDLDFSEVMSGLASGDEVLLLPSSDLVRSQQRFQEQMRRFTSLPGMQSRDSSEQRGNSNASR